MFIAFATALGLWFARPAGSLSAESGMPEASGFSGTLGSFFTADVGIGLGLGLGLAAALAGGILLGASWSIRRSDRLRRIPSAPSETTAHGTESKAARSATRAKHDSNDEISIHQPAIALPDTRAFNEIMIGNSVDAFLVWDVEGTIEHASPSAERLFGRSPGRLVGSSLRHLLDPRHHASYDQRRSDWDSDDRNRRLLDRPIMLYGLRPDGSRFPFEMVPYETKADGRRLFAAMLRDVSERVQAQQALQRSESLRAVLDALPDAVLVHRDEILLYVNPTFLRILGYSEPNQVIGRPLKEFIQPVDWARVQRRLREVEVRGKPLEPAEERFRDREGATVTLEVAKVPVVFDSKPAVAAIGRNVSHRRLEERRMRQIVESAPNGMVMTGPDGRIVLANGHVEEFFGYREDELLGEEIEILISERHRGNHPELRDAYVGKAASQPTGVGVELYARRKDGSEFPVEIILNPIQMEEGLFMLRSIVDLRERKKVESLIAMADRMTAVGTLAAGVAHGINNPLAYVKGNLQFARAEITKLAPDYDEEAREHIEGLEIALDQAIEGADRIRDTVGDLLTYARHESSEVSHGIDLQNVLDSVTRMIRNELRHRTRVEKDYQAAPVVVGDSSRLAHAFTNLLVNAAHAIPEGHAHENLVRISTSTDADSGFAIVEISDSGSGISDSVLPHVFEPFFTTKPVGSGVGLGLSVSQGIISGLGGHILIESELGVGTTVRVLLPPGRVREPRKKVSHRIDAGGSKRILVVDDEPRVLEMLGRLLSRHDVTMATGAREALGRIGSGERFDLIICDLMMPDTTGAQLHAALRAAHPDQADRVIFMTGGAFTTESQSFVEGVSTPVLHKPIELPALEAAIAAVAEATEQS